MSSAVYKYVVMDVDGTKVPVLFPSHISHRGMAQALTRVICDEARKPTLPVSAGFVSVEAGAVFDESESLNLRPADGDCDPINLQYCYAHSFQRS